MKRLGTSPHPGAAATKETAPWHIWHAAVVEIAGVSFEDYRPERERAARAYQAGESAEMYAGELAFKVEQGRKHAKVDADAAALRRMIALGARSH